MSWYERRSELNPGMIFQTRGQGLVMLDGYVPGDGTRMYCADRCGGQWVYQDSTVEPGDLIGDPLTEAAIVKAEG